MQKAKTEVFCLPCCRSIEHAEEIATAILRGSEDQALAFMCWRCANYKGLVDEAGRSALHFASSCGKTKVIRWLLRDDRNINLKDKESGYTPLHRSIFHGQLNSAKCLIMHGARLDILDNDGLTALDHFLRDKKIDDGFAEVNLGIIPWKGSTNPMNEVYVWGSNSNFNLGIGSHQIRRQPDTIDFFWKNRISIKRVAMGKYHSIFLSDDGRVYSCGIGQGGRLGLESEETVMTPNQINISAQTSFSSSSRHVVINVSVGQDHSLLVTDKGTIYSFGMNDYYQLGLIPPPPFQLTPRPLHLSLRHPIGVSAAHYHSVAWSHDELYTWGFNCGQLGYLSENKYQLTPKLVTNLRNSAILSVASTDSAIVVVTDKGEVLLLREFGCLRIGTVTTLVRCIQISGGRLDPTLIKSADVSAWGDYRTGEDDLKVLLVLWEGGTIFWQSSTSLFSRCCFQVGSRFLKVADAALGINKLIVVTEEYDAYETDVNIPKMPERNMPSGTKSHSHRLMAKDIPVVFQMKRIGYIYRALNAYCDPKGLNFAIIQVNPIFLTPCPQEIRPAEMESSLVSLLEEATESDGISDVVFNVAGYRIPAHRYILESNCTKLSSLVNSVELEKKTLLQNSEIKEDIDDDSNSSVLTVVMDKFHPLVFKEILKYIYSGLFDYITPSTWSPEKDSAYSRILLGNKSLMHHYSALLNPDTADQNSSKVTSTSNTMEYKDHSTFEYNPVADIRRTADYFELRELVKVLDNFVYSKKKGAVYPKSYLKASAFEKRKVYLNQHNFQHLYDVMIECNEGKLISAHKCVLSMRSKYFDTMLKGNWVECKERRTLFLPFSYEVVEAILAYLYQDKIPFTTNAEDVGFICQVLVAADHILLDGLKLICEFSLAHLLTLKNVSELYKFSDTYSAFQLKGYCLKYIVPNIAPLLESRALDSVDDDLFNNIQTRYWQLTPVVLQRSVGFPMRNPDIGQLQSILETVGVPSEEEYFRVEENVCKTPQRKEANDVPRKRKSSRKSKSKKNSTDERIESTQKLPLHSSQGEDWEANSGLFGGAISLPSNSRGEIRANFYREIEFGNSCGIDLESKTEGKSSNLILNEKESLNGNSKEETEVSPKIEKEFPSLIGDKKELEVSPKIEKEFPSLIGDKKEPEVSPPIEKEFPSLIGDKKEPEVSPQIEKEFPSLIGDMQLSTTPSAARVPKQRMVKLSQKARKKLRDSAGIAVEPQQSQQESSVERNPWKKNGNDSQEQQLSSGLEVISLSQIMNEERRRCLKPQSSFTETVYEENTSPLSPKTGAVRKWSTGLSSADSIKAEEKPFDEIIADELKQREITRKIMEKPLNLTQTEDKAIKELQLLYEKEHGFEEQIIVRRNISCQASKPVWKTSKQP